MRGRFAIRARTVAAFVLTSGLLLAGAGSAAAADGLWYVDVLAFESAHAEGVTGKGVTIAVIDGQINTAVPAIAKADIDVHEPSFCYDDSGELAPAASARLSATEPTDHGTNVVSMIVGSGEGYSGQNGIVGIAPAAKILYYASYTSSDDDAVGCNTADGSLNINAQAEALTSALDAGADIVSISLSTGASPDYVDALARAFREGVPVVASVQNAIGMKSTGGGMPGYANGAIGVQAAGADGGIQQTEGTLNIDELTDVVSPGLGITVQGNAASGSWEEQLTANGTSLATPLVAGALALVKQKYPDATGNQLVQSLIHNTKGEPDHEPEYDPANAYGYGLISVANLLSVDPTNYSDVNPLIREATGPDDLVIPTYAQIFDTAGESPEPSNSPSSESDGDNQSMAPAVGLIVGIVVGGLVLVVIIVLIVVFAARRSRSAATTSRQGRQP